LPHQEQIHADKLDVSNQQISDATLFSKNKQVNLKNKPKIGNLTEKQAQNALAGKFNKTKN